MATVSTEWNLNLGGNIRDAILRVQYGIDPQTLSDQDWAQRFQEWVYVRRMELEAQEAIMENAFRKVMYEVVNAVFGKK
ncbi:MAG: hypothetical protein GX163_10870 [Bacteroidetes bacterium]|jgi:hypothetical protein|nr:hypothetical protein [Bacteroidota bacterium]